MLNFSHIYLQNKVIPLNIFSNGTYLKKTNGYKSNWHAMFVKILLNHIYLSCTIMDE